MLNDKVPRETVADYLAITWRYQGVPERARGVKTPDTYGGIQGIGLLVAFREVAYPNNRGTDQEDAPLQDSHHPAPRANRHWFHVKQAYAANQKSSRSRIFVICAGVLSL